jgi:predicted AAA+ superfamily ATPase
MDRALIPSIRRDMKRKIVLITGARQAGKTTLARMLTPDHDYLNFDFPPHRLDIRERSWDRKKELVIFDELHKLKGWKSWLKGIYDVEGLPPAMVVTGSARLDTSRKSGDSLAGRFFQYRLHPFDVKEVQTEIDADEAFSRIMNLGGFPEPFLENDSSYYERWRKSHTDTILRQDLIDLETVRDIVSIETLVELLRRRVGSPVSYSSLARDLERDSSTVKRWLGLLENLYVVFPVRPYHRNIARAILKEPKFYFYDTGLVEGDTGARFENLCACALLKEIHRIADCQGRDAKLHYLRTKDGRELNFVVLEKGKDPLLLEVRYGDDKPCPAFKHFAGFFPTATKIQLVKEIKREKTYPDGLQVRNAVRWLAGLEW